MNETPEWNMEWQKVDDRTPDEQVILFFPKLSRDRGGKMTVTHGKMVKVGRVCDTPFRQPTHWMPIPADPE